MTNPALQLMSKLMAMFLSFLASGQNNYESRWLPGDGVPGVNGSIRAITMRALSLTVSVFMVHVVVVTPNASAQCEAQWLSSIAQRPPGVAGEVYAIQPWDPDGPGPLAPGYLLGGSIAVAGDREVHNIAFWSDDGWSTLGNGLGDAVNAIAVMADNSVVAGGVFATAGGVAAASIARWNGTQWAPLGAGTNGSVSVLRVRPDGYLVVGGDFDTAGGIASANVAIWTGAAWQGMAGGVVHNGSSASRVEDIDFLPTGEVLVSGRFDLAGNVAAPMIAAWNGSTWRAIGHGFDESVRSAVVAGNGDVIAAGFFSSSGGAPVSNTVVWNGSSWASLGGGVPGSALALAVTTDGELLCGTNSPSACVFRLDGGSWVPMGERAYGNTYALHADANGILVGGGFGRIGLAACGGLAQWDGSAWGAVGPGLTGQVRAWDVLPSGDLVAAGYFFAGQAPGSGGVARLVDGQWIGFGSGLEGEVQDIAVRPDGRVIAVGWFHRAGQPLDGEVAEWDGSAWNRLGGLVNNTVTSAALLAGGDIVVCGAFTSISSVPLSRVARWDGSAWQPMGSGMNGLVRKVIATSDGGIVACGAFTAAGGVPAARIARWNGTLWQPVLPNLSEYVLDDAYTVVERSPGVLCVGGNFFTSSGAARPPIQVFDGSQWLPLVGSENIQGAVLSIESMPDDSLLVSGQFSVTGNAHAGSLARWRNGVWTSLGSGIGGWNVVRETRMLSDGTIAVGGGFTQAGGEVAAYWSLFGLPPNCRCDPIDFNHDTLFPDTLDIADFLTVFAGGVCDGQLPTDPPCNTDIDFNNDTLFPDTADIQSLLSVFAGGSCV